MLEDEKKIACKIHDDIENRASKITEKVNKIDKIQHGVLITLGILTTSCVAVGKKVLGF
jgi:hypothetical protein